MPCAEIFSRVNLHFSLECFAFVTAAKSGPGSKKKTTTTKISKDLQNNWSSQHKLSLLLYRAEGKNAAQFAMLLLEHR